MSSLRLRYALAPVVLAASVFAYATDAPAKKAASPVDLHIKKNISVNGYSTSAVDVSIKGARERTTNGTSVTIRQCDLKRTLNLNEENQSYTVTNDPQDTEAARAAAIATGAQVADSDGAIAVTTTITDTGERKVLFGYPARHLKASIVEESAAKACSQVHEKYELDGWYTDIAVAQAGCAHFVPPVRQGDNCHDPVVSKRIGSGRPGYPLVETITMHNADASSTSVRTQTEELSKQENLPDELFDIPPGYHQVGSAAELHAAAQPLQQASPIPAASQLAAAPSATSQPTPQDLAATAQASKPAHKSKFSLSQMMGSMGGGSVAQLAAQKTALAQMPQAGGAAGMMSQLAQMAPAGLPQANGSVPGMAANQTTPQPLGPKKQGMIRIGVAPPDAQLGQGNNAGADYSTPIRNAIVAIMNGPAVEVTPLDSHIAMQLQAEAQQKQCDYVLYSAVAVKRSSGGGLGKFMKTAVPIASNLTPMGMMAHSMGGMMAMQAASSVASAASQQAQQQAISQLAGFNGQVKSKDDVTVQYQLVQTGQATPVVQNALQGKAKSDGEDVLTPMLQDTANTVLNTVTKK